MSLNTRQVEYARNDLKRERNRLSSLYEFLRRSEIHAVALKVSDAISDIDRAWEMLGNLTAVESDVDGNEL